MTEKLGPYVYDRIDEIRGCEEPGTDILFLLAIVDDVFALLEYAHVDDMRCLADQSRQHWVLDIQDWLLELDRLRAKYDLRESHA
jgi:hypothetical protein